MKHPLFDLLLRIPPMHVQKCKIYRWPENPLLYASMSEHLLFVPVVDLMNISEHNLVFAPHVIWNPLLFHPAHVALQRHSEPKDVVTRDTMAWTSNMRWHNLRRWRHPHPPVHFPFRASTLRVNMYMAM